MPQPKVLIIDDDQVIVRATSLILTRKGFDARGALDGEEGLRAVSEYRPDVILLDLSMPKMDGWEVLERLRTDASTSAIPVVIFTAEKSDVSRMAVERGAADFVAKPFEPEELTAVLRKHVGRAQPLGGPA